MKGRDIKRKPKRINIDSLLSENEYILSESEDHEFIISTSELKKVSDIKSRIIIKFDNPDISSNLTFKIVCEHKINIDLFVLIKAENGIGNISSSLDMRALLLDQEARITFVPSLEIDEMNVSVDHKSSIGSLPDQWVEYMATRGLSKDNSVQLLKDAFINSI